MMQVEFKIQGNAPAFLKSITAIMGDQRGLLKVVGRRAAEELRKHFGKLETTHPNKMGGKRSHFWRGVRDSVQMPFLLGKSQTVVTVAHPVIAHKVGIGPAGGWIRPQEKKWLAIPAIAAAYDKSPLEWSEGGGATHELTFFKKNEQTAFLAEVELKLTPDMTRYNLDDDKGYLEHGLPKVKKPKKKQVLHIIFILKKKVFQKPMPDAMPSQGDWNKSMGEELNDFWEREKAKAVLPAKGETLK